MSKVLSASTILAAQDLEIVEEQVPEWKDEDGNPGIVLIHQLNAEESMALTRAMDTVEMAKDGMFIMLVFCAHDRDGNRLFTMEDIPALRKKSFRVIDRLQRVALRVNQMDPRAERERKNGSSEAVTVDSPTASLPS